MTSSSPETVEMLKARRSSNNNRLFFIMFILPLVRTRAEFSKGSGVKQASGNSGLGLSLAAQDHTAATRSCQSQIPREPVCSGLATQTPNAETGHQVPFTRPRRQADSK